jgi:formamidase
MTAHAIEIDVNRPLADEPHLGHNRWHEEIEPAIEVDPGDEVVFETRDSVDGQIRAETIVADLQYVEVGRVHPLTGPAYVRGARPGDLLEIELLDIEPDPWQRRGFTRQLPGFGFLRDEFPDPYLVHWALDEVGYAESEQLPGVRIPCRPFPGIVGVAPSRDLRRAITRRENDLADRGGMVGLPTADGAVPTNEAVAREGLRTYPPRETGGNLDIRQMTPGVSIFIPVWVEGALVSIGDVHYAQGDGEVCGNGIEMKARVTVRCRVHEGEAERRAIRDVRFLRTSGDTDTSTGYGRFFAVTGVCVDRDGRNEGENVTLAARNALRNMIEHLGAHGFDRQQAYAICSCAVDLRISQAVNIPNPLVSAILPLDIFVGSKPYSR